MTATTNTPHTRPKGYDDIGEIAAVRAKLAAGEPLASGERRRRYPWEPRTSRAADHVAKASRKVNR